MLQYPPPVPAAFGIAVASRQSGYGVACYEQLAIQLGCGGRFVREFGLGLVHAAARQRILELRGDLVVEDVVPLAAGVVQRR